MTDRATTETDHAVGTGEADRMTAAGITMIDNGAMTGHVNAASRARNVARHRHRPHSSAAFSAG